MVYINPAKLLEVTDTLERQNIEYNTIYEELCQCRSDLEKFSSFSNEQNELGKVCRELLIEIENQRKQIDVLNQATELYLMSDDRALDRADDRVVIPQRRPGITEMEVPKNDVPIQMN